MAGRPNGRPATRLAGWAKPGLGGGQEFARLLVNLHRIEPIVLPKARIPTTGLWERLAFLAATLTAVGSLYMSMGMGLHACPLCFYQRAFIMAVAGVLGVGIALRPPPREGSLSILALPLAIAGLGVALIHNVLIWSGVLVCPLGILGLGTAPLQSSDRLSGGNGFAASRRAAP